MSNTKQHNGFAWTYAERFPAFAPSSRPSLAHTRSAQLRDDYGLLELTHGTEHLTDEHTGRIFVGRGEVGSAVGGDDADAEVTELREQNFRNEQIAGETIGRLRVMGMHGPYREVVLDDDDALRKHHL